MKLTGRQESFLGKFLDLYSQAEVPLHYTHVAEVLGVGKITAYDMLRVLEKRGLVRAEYVLRGKGKGAGRSTVVFVPTSQARVLFAELAGEGWDEAEWETVKTQILNALRRRTDYQNLLDEILARLPERTTPLVYAAEMVTAVILNLLLVEEGASTSALVERLKALGLPGEVGLNALSGLAMGLSLVERANRRLTDKLVDAVRGYQRSLVRLRGEGSRHLSSFVQEVMKAVTTHKE
jgi:Mn-dependent DtxR family transcriptional regulator